MQTPESSSGPNTYPSGRIVLAASTGGHLAQLVRIRSRLGSDVDPLWVTFDSAQSRGLLEQEEVLYVPYIAPRDWRGVVTASRAVARRLGAEAFQGGISTGAALALAVLPQLRSRGADALYIESISRFEGPSLTGRLLQAIPGITLRSQHPGWTSKRWGTEPAVLGDYAVVAKAMVPEAPLRIFVTLGTIRPYRFDALIDAVMQTGLVNTDTVWQVGETGRGDLTGKVTAYMTASEFQETASNADVVITHAGVGTVLNLLDAGIFPIIVPRTAVRGEHVDDHQYQIARYVEDMSLGLARTPAELCSLDIVTASRKRVKVS